MSWSYRRFMAGVITFILLIGVWVLVYLPPYEKIVFWNSEACGYDAVRQNPYNFEGDKGGGGFPVIKKEYCALLTEEEMEEQYLKFDLMGEEFEWCTEEYFLF